MSDLSDAQTAIQVLRQMVKTFVDQRDWRQFHTPKNLSMSLAIEAAELMEHFQWLTPDESRQLLPEKLDEVGEEMADVLCYLLALANELELDLSAALESKMIKNRLKYPVTEFRGRFGTEDPRPVSQQERVE
jgi:NTP pyrophosphatase (non-canonical NTP hydrolase)